MYHCTITRVDVLIVIIIIWLERTRHIIGLQYIQYKKICASTNDCYRKKKITILIAMLSSLTAEF